ncbi:MAG: GNAT family N-acetyltransferase [Ilumatobacteraceae bacterium]
MSTLRVDAGLVRRIEASAALAAQRTTAALARRAPLAGARSASFDGGALVSWGVGRYVNRGIGLGIGTATPARTLDALEEFSAACGVRPALEVTPWVPRSFLDELAARGYTVQWFRQVLARAGNAAPCEPMPVTFTEVADGGAVAWAAILGESTVPGSAERMVSDELCDASRSVAERVDLLAHLDGRAVGCGMYEVAGDVGWIGAAATLTAARGRGVQRALIDERLRRLHAVGVDLVGATALADGPSARNLVAAGFEVLYTQVVMAR